MAKKKSAKENVLNITNLIFKSPKIVIQGIKSSIEDLPITKVIQTYVMESNGLKVAVLNNGKTIYSGIVKWIGNKDDHSPGIIICATNDGKNYQMISPTEETVQSALLDVEKRVLRINAVEKTKCSVCGKGLGIFDSILACPLCGSKAHKDHLQEWVKMKHSCPICKKELELDANNLPVPKQ